MSGNPDFIRINPARSRRSALPSSIALDRSCETPSATTMTRNRSGSVGKLGMNPPWITEATCLVISPRTRAQDAYSAQLRVLYQRTGHRARRDSHLRPADGLAVFAGIFRTV